MVRHPIFIERALRHYSPLLTGEVFMNCRLPVKEGHLTGK
jgi:hypothetical protein